MTDLVLHAQILYNTPISDVYRNNSDFYYLLRNGFGETMVALNTSIEYFINDEEESMYQFLNIILILAISAISLMFVCFFLVIVPTLRSVENSNQTVWSLFYLLPLDLVLELKSRCEERLETMHGLEPEKRIENSKFKSLETRNNIRASSKWKGILVRLSIYYIVSAAFFIFFYFLGYQTFGNTLEIKPRINNWAGIRSQAINSAYY